MSVVRAAASDEAEHDIPPAKMMKLWDLATREAAREVEDRIMSVVGSLGGNTFKYRRERGKAFRAIVSEIYSPPRLSAVA